MVDFITLEQYFGGPAPSPELEANAKDLLLKVNSILTALGYTSITMTSGYRSPEHNVAIGGAKKSLHCQAKAIDLEDNERKLGNSIMRNQWFLLDRDMAMEALSYCVRANGNKWVHLQSELPHSGNTIFIPYAGPPKLT